MIYGISGAHRSGKSTLAKAVAEDMGLTYLDASVSKIMKENGYDAVGKLSFGQRLEAQRKLLDVHRAMLEAQTTPAITDRTPIDMAGYMLCEAGMHSDPELGEAVYDYLSECINMTVSHYDGLLVTRPLPYYQVEPGKPAENKGYQWHLQMFIEGAVSNLHGQMTYGLLRTIDFDQRRESAGEFVHSLMQDSANERMQAHLH